MKEKEYVGALILNPNNEILLQKKDLNYKKWPGYWTTFGGAVEESDKTILDALQREVVLEETSLHLSDMVLFEDYYIDESLYGVRGKPNPSRGWCHFFAARFDGDLSKIILGEGAGFSAFGEEELPFYRERTLPYVYDVIQRFYQSLKGNASQ